MPRRNLFVILRACFLCWFCVFRSARENGVNICNKPFSRHYEYFAISCYACIFLNPFDLTANNYTDEYQNYKCDDEEQRAEEGMEESICRLSAVSVCNQQQGRNAEDVSENHNWDCYT